MLVKCESFMYMNAAQVKRKWTQYGSDPSSQAGRFGGNSQAFRFGNSGVRFGLASPPQTVLVGGAFKFGAFSQLSFMWGQSNGQTQWSLSVDNSGHIRIHYGTRSTTVIATSTSTLNLNVWYFIEIKHKSDNSTGTVEVRVNGSATGWITLSSQDTQVSGGNANTDTVGYGAEINDNGQQLDFTDLYIADTSGSVNNDFLGDVRVEAILPTGAGNYTEFDTLVGAGSHAAAVDDPSPQDDDTTYVASSTTGQRDTFAAGNITPTAGTVLAVQLGAIARKDDAGDRQLKVMARLSSSDAESGAQVLGTEYAAVLSVMETKPGGGAWSIADVNNAEIGVRVG